MKISSIVVLGAGSAGLMTALTLKRKLPQLSVRVVRSPDIAIIGVGEATTLAFLKHFFEYLRMKPRDFYMEARPTWKMGIRFLWGPRKEFFYTFAFEFEKRLPELTRNNGFYYSEERPWLGRSSAFMAHDKVFPRRPDGMPQFHGNHAFHIENVTYVGWLENRCREIGVVITDATVKAETGGEGIAALITSAGERITGDLYVDASGFRSELLGRALNEPFRSYADSLFSDRAVIGGWPRAKGEPILPYTVAETMDAGWCWRIPVVGEDHLRSGRIEAIEKPVEVCGRHALGQGGRAADVGEEHRDIDLCPAVVAREEPVAPLAKVGVPVGSTLADEPHNRRPCPGEGCGTQLAARITRNVFEDASNPPLRRCSVGQELAPEPLVVVPTAGSAARGHGS
jgi:hypothetical protein